jgi:hypothetical protein
LHSATSSAATKFAALEGLPRDEEPLLDFLEGVLSLVVPGEEPLFFWLLLMVTAMTTGQGEWGTSNGATATAMIDQSMTTGQWQQQLQWHQGRGTGATGAMAMAMGQRQRSIVPIAMIDRVDVWGVGRGRGRVLFRVLYSKHLVNARMEDPLKE